LEKRHNDENYIGFMQRVVSAVRTKEIDYEEMGRLLFGEEIYSSENLRKIYYGLDLVCENISNEYNYLVGKRILVVSDFHVPFQLPIETFYKYRGNTDIIVFLGDLVDLQQISKFKSVRRNTPMDDIIAMRQYLIDLIEYINPKEIYGCYGNHEIRFYRYIAKNLDNDLCELLPRTPLSLVFEDGFHHYNNSERTKVWYEPLGVVFPDKKIVYTNDWKIEVGDTILAHPLAFNSGTLKTSERAMDYFLREGKRFKNLCLAHTHRSGETDIGAIRLYEIGACCDTEHNNYNDGRLISSQKEGFLYLVQDNDGNTIRNLTKRIVLN
jgi:predicted phosphodiesterase